MSDYRDRKSFTCILNYVGKNLLIKLLFWCVFCVLFWFDFVGGFCVFWCGYFLWGGEEVVCFVLVWIQKGKKQFGRFEDKKCL